MTQVFDEQGNERDVAWLAAEYDGCQVLPAGTDGAREVWRLAAVYVTEGPAVVKVEARRGIGRPAAGQPVVLTWPRLDAPDSDLGVLPASPLRWADRGVWQVTNAEGVSGFGLGAVYGPFYHAWVWSSVPSDCLSGLGMKGGTNHRGPLHGVWMLQEVEQGFATLEEALRAEAQAHQRIEFNPMAALQGRMFADGFVPNSPEFDVTFGGVTYRAQRGEHLGSGVVRCYFAELGQWNAVRLIEW